MKLGSVKMILTVGNAGTGKTTDINNVLGSINNSDVFLTAPNRTASNRLLGNVRNVNRLLKVRVNFNSYSSNKSSNIIIDEFGEMAKITFESLLTHINNQKKLGQDVNIYCYGDSHQLPSINKLGALDAIWLENEQIFTGDVKEFDGWMDQLYSNLEDGTLLNVVDDWKNYIDSIQVKVLRKNYRMEASGWNATDFNEDFFQELRDKHSFNSNYQLYLNQCLKEGWMIVSPIYDRLKEANKKLSDIGVSDVEEFPFVSPKEHRSEVYLNPYNTKLKQLRKRIPDIPTIEKEKVNQEKWDFMCGCVVANVQGMEFDKICFYMGDSPISVMSHDVYIVNNFHTGLTRGKKDWMYLGNLTDFDKMLNTPRKDVWEQLELDNNNKALQEVIYHAPQKYFGTLDVNPYKEYEEIMYEEGIVKGKWSESTFAIALRDKIKNDHLDIPLYLTWAKNVISTSKYSGNSKGGKNSAGKGKNQSLYNNLSTALKLQFPDDRKNRNFDPKDFKEKYGMTKDQARKIRITQPS